MKPYGDPERGIIVRSFASVMCFSWGMYGMGLALNGGAVLLGVLGALCMLGGILSYISLLPPID